jgi:hypothetical protein
MPWNDDLVALKRFRDSRPDLYRAGFENENTRPPAARVWIVLFLAVYVVMPVVGVAVISGFAYLADFLFSPRFYFAVHAALTFLTNSPR